jgi:hypothetical protein
LKSADEAGRVAGAQRTQFEDSLAEVVPRREEEMMDHVHARLAGHVGVESADFYLGILLAPVIEDALE